MVQFIRTPSTRTRLTRFLLLLLGLALIGYVLHRRYNTLGHIESTVRHWLAPDSEPRPPSTAPGHARWLRPVEVTTHSGTLRGFVQNVSHVEVNTFLSVPFGQSPVGKLRFRRTEPVGRWAGVRDATRVPPPCIQSEYTQRLFPVHILNENITEDCLFLNIWSPAWAGRSLRSVMVFIHGGMFTVGSIGIDEYDGRVLAAVGDVVVVTVQYRLALFGFLDLDTPQVPGNMGLYDQYTALEWIQHNIHFFGGDKHSVTLFGTSAGAISIGLHMFSPLAGPLFKRAILQSGSPLLLRDVYSRGEALAEKFASLVGCFRAGNGSVYDEADSVLDCLDRTPLDKIYAAQGEMVRNNPVAFMPTIPSDYAENFVNDYNESTPIAQKQVLLGFNQNEGALILHAAYPQLYQRNSVPEYRRLKEVQQRVVEMGVDAGLRQSQAASVASLLIKGDDGDSPAQWAAQVANLFSDMMFVCPAYEFATKLLSLNVSTHLYLFAQRARASAWGEWMGVTHHDEVVFVMGYPIRYPRAFSKDDVDTSFRMIKTWAHFAKTGQIAHKYYPEAWRPYEPVSKPYMRIEARHSHMGSHFHNQTCDLYNLLSDYIS